LSHLVRQRLLPLSRACPSSPRHRSVCGRAHHIGGREGRRSMTKAHTESETRTNLLPSSRIVLAATAAMLALLVGAHGSVHADGNLHRVNHIIIVMQENHSFDNYFGVLPYASGTPYHRGAGACASSDHTCVDGLGCTRDSAGSYTCTNS